MLCILYIHNMAFTQKHVNILLVSIAVVILIIVIYHYSCAPSEKEYFQNNQCVIQRASIDKLAKAAVQNAAQTIAASKTSVPAPVASPTVKAVAASSVTTSVKKNKVRGILEATDQAKVNYPTGNTPQHQAPQFKTATVRGVKEDLTGAPILKKVTYPTKDVQRNDGSYMIDGESTLEGDIGLSVGSLGNYHMNEQNKCAISKNVFQQLNNNGYLTDDQVPKTWNKLYKTSCGGWA
jgi:hypothetical protein